jgi:tetratricopeptide (TPR) repeat protein
LLSNSSGHDVEVLNMALKELEANRPKEHLLLANAVLKEAEELSSDAGISLLASLLPYGDKPLADGVYRQFIQHKEFGQEEELRALAVYHAKYGRIREALALLEQALWNNKEGNQVNHEGQAEFFRVMAEQWMHLGQYDKALDLVDQSQTILAKYGLLTPEKEAMLCTTRGELFGHKSLYMQALSAYQTAHDLYQKSSGPFHKWTLKAVFRLSQTYMQLGKYDQSMQLAEQGKQMTTRSLGESNPTYSDFIQFIGDLYDEKGHYDDALVQFTKALDIELEYFGDSHPYISGSYCRIGDIWETKGDYDKALDYFERSMAINLQ